MRILLFPDTLLRPKHHFLTHYPDLIVKFGPLIKVWTLRFESKHQYFKKTIRHILNFKNVGKSLSEKHELFQSLLRLGSDNRLETNLYNISDFKINLYDQKIQIAIRNCLQNINIENIQQCERVVYKGTEYKKGFNLVLRADNFRANVVIGKICLILFDETTVYLLCEAMDTEFIPVLSTFKIGPILAYECCKLNQLVNYKPFYIYRLKSMHCIKPSYNFLKHYLFRSQSNNFMIFFFQYCIIIFITETILTKIILF